MKIYHRKRFAAGVFLVALGTGNWILDLINQTVEIKGILLVLTLYLFGFGAILRSLSPKWSQEDRLEELDERNQLIEFKSKSKAFDLTRGISLFLMLAVLVMGKVSGDVRFIAMGVGMAFLFVVSLFAELFTFMYYESKN